MLGFDLMVGAEQMDATMTSLEIMVNADDFGMNSDVNTAILGAFHDGLLTSTTVMANMPAFEEACAVASNELAGKIGVHLNLTEGKPITEPIRRCNRFCTPEGEFRPRSRVWRLTPEELNAVSRELQAQVDACIRRGVVPSHLDSHNHVHTEWAIGRVVIEIARQFDIHGVRLARNCGRGKADWRNVYTRLYNERLQRAGLARTKYFGSMTDFASVGYSADGPVEVMVHPRLAPNGSVVDIDGSDLGMLLQPVLSLRPLGAAG